MDALAAAVNGAVPVACEIQPVCVQGGGDA
jgi:hypothetical protein